MDDLDRLRQQRATVSATETALHGAREQLGSIRARVAVAERQGEDATLRRLRGALEDVEGRSRQLQATLVRERATAEAIRQKTLSDTHDWRSLSKGLPIVLLPVRLETHFVQENGRVSQLLVRVFPDDVHVQDHEAELSKEEAKAARSYFEQVWRAGPSPERRQLAWRHLAERFGELRASYLAEQLRPLNAAPVLDAPLPADASLPHTPEFPEVNLKSGAWTQAPRAAALPDRWISLGFRGGERLFTVSGTPIVEPLAVGPDPTLERDESDEALVDEASRWLVDFEQALAVGMALRVVANERLDLEPGLDLLLVLGVNESVTAPEGAELLTQLLEAKRYTAGVQLLSRGVPTNNTEAARSTWQETSSPGPDTTEPAATPLPANTAGGRWGSALGLDVAQTQRAFATVDGAIEQHDGAARAMNAALWPATWGYLLEYMAGEQVKAHIPALRDHVLAWLRPGGHHACLRIGSQPYGLLVHTDLERLTPGDPKTAGPLLQLLLRLRRHYWEPGVERAPRVGRSADPDADLLAVLGQQAASSTFALRPALGPLFMANLRELFGSPASSPFWTNHQRLALEALPQLELPVSGALLGLGFHPAVSEEIRTLVQAGQSTAGQLLSPNYVGWLRTLNHEQLEREQLPGPVPQTLLYKLLRQAALHETVREAHVRLDHAPGGFVTVKQEPELVDVQPTSGTSANPAWTPARVLRAVVPGVTDGLSVGDYLLAQRASTAPAAARFKEFWDALERLETLPVDRLELLLRETLDASSHRLDAWLTSFAAQTLASRRDAAATGVYVGGYGWVEQLRPRAGRVSDGYVHLPSVRHASLAAVLRSGYLSHRRAANSEVLGVDLSSERVRLATWLLDGVRAGQPLGALLGYRLERGLHEEHGALELDAYVHALRRRAPLVAGKVNPQTEPLEAIAARNVVDGLALVRMWQRGALSFGGDLPNQGTPAHAAIVAELEALAELIDAVGDSLLAESVFQMDNPSRAAASLDAVASGEVPPPELQFAKTPRHGLGLVHRVVTLLPAAPGFASAWPGSVGPASARQVRALIDPAIEVWVASVLGPPNRYVYRVRYGAGADAIVESRDLSTLELSALDALALSEAEASELLDVCRHHALSTRPAAVGADVAIEIESGETDGSVAFATLSELARAVHQVLSRARPLSGRELAALGESVNSGIDLADLEARAGQAVSRFAAVTTRLDVLLVDALLSETQPVDLNEVVSVLRELNAFGVPRSVPVAIPELPEARSALVRQMAAVQSETQSRLRKLAAADRDFATSDGGESSRVAHARGRVLVVTGSAWGLFPKFTAPSAPELARASSAQEELTRGERTAAVQWLQRNARVRESLTDFNELLLYDGAQNARSPYSFRVMQLPFRADAVWAALPHAPDRELDANRLSLLAYTPLAVQIEQPLTGFVVDDWSETLPFDSETTALTFQFDQPGARAPNVLLLAVAAEPEGVWNVNSLERIVRDALAMAKIRAVDGDSLRGLGQFLPGMLFATNVGGDTLDARWEALVGAAALREDG